MEQAPSARIILSGGLAIMLIGMGIDKYVHPELWLGWLPLQMEGLLSMDRLMWLKLIAGIEVLLGIGILLPMRLARQAASAILVLHLLSICAIVFWMTGWNDILLRDIGLLAAAIALSSLL